jgi:DNA-binding IclR family transcriptional regulator
MNTDDPVAAGETGPRSPLRTVQVLHALAASGQGVALGTLAASLQLPKTSLFRLLRSLEQAGYVRSQDGIHEVGPEALKLGAALVRACAFPKCARPVMAWLASQCDETVILATADDSGTEVVYSEVIEATNPLRFSIRPGLAKPLYSSASGQVLLAYATPEHRATYVRQVKFVRLAAGTITSGTALQRNLRAIRAQGYAVSVDGMFDGVYSIAAPVFDAGGAVQAGLSISAPSSRGLQQEDRFRRLLQQAAEEISRLLGYTGSCPPA